jgi:hypothetical protein
MFWCTMQGHSPAKIHQLLKFCWYSSGHVAGNRHLLLKLPVSRAVVMSHWKVINYGKFLLVEQSSWRNEQTTTIDTSSPYSTGHGAENMHQTLKIPLSTAVVMAQWTIINWCKLLSVHCCLVLDTQTDEKLVTEIGRKPSLWPSFVSIKQEGKRRKTVEKVQWCYCLPKQNQFNLVKYRPARKYFVLMVVTDAIKEWRYRVESEKLANCPASIGI